MSFLQKLFFWGKNFFFPSACALCSCSLFDIADIKYALCSPCRISIVNIQKNNCAVCGKPLISENKTCIPCRSKTENFYERLWVLYPYNGKYRKLLAMYKFIKNLALAVFFIEKILEIIKNNPVLKEAAIIPVPPRPGKIKHSGWDQIDYLVKRLKKTSACIQVSSCLKRKKSKVQKYLNRTERLENLKGRIYTHGAVPKIALIIDDVITTGSTIEVCAKVLKQAGAEKVYALCLFYD